MTKHDLIARVGGIERAREILEGSPEGATHINQSPNYFKNIKYKDCEMWNSHNQSWFDADVYSFDVFITLNGLRAAITSHKPKFKVGDLVVVGKQNPLYVCQGYVSYERAKTKVVRVMIKHTNGKKGAICKSLGEIRHATPQEVKTGHRIELSSNSGQLEVLDMIHVSPSAVVIDYE